MPPLIDHVVILVPELDAAIAGYTQLGFTVQRGGTHVDGRTHNALVGFADGSYLELIAFLHPPGEHRWARFAAAGWSGFVDWALRPEDVDSMVRNARACGVDYSDPLDGGRLRPDGERLRWQIGTPPTPDLPFFCGDLTPRSLRVPEGEVRRHANGAQGVAAVTLLVNDLEASRVRYEALLGSASQALALPGAGLRQAVLALGDVQLVLASPLGSGAAADSLRELLARRGEGVIGLVLRSTAVAAPQELALAAAQQATIALQPA